MKKLTLFLSLILLISCSKKEGCIDDIACNFESSAEIDDGSCTYAEEYYDCDSVCLSDTDSDGVCDELEVSGCMDDTACNYDDTATDDEGCEFAEEYYDCNGECIIEVDCLGVCGGDAVEDMCGECDIDPDNDCVQDCADVWGGNAIEDCAGVCDGNAIEDCAGVCDGNAEVLTYWYDGDGDGLGAGESSEFCDALVEEGWVLNNDDNDDNCISNIHDCAGICDGDAVEDMCGECDIDPDNDCVQDCADVWGGTTQPEDCYVTDIDGNVYQNVQIGAQLWMAENLKVTHYKNGDAIPTGYSNSEWADLDETETGAYAFYNDDPSYADTYGNLYNWYIVDDERGVCPQGWHVPTDEEFKELEMALGMSESEANTTGFRGTNEGSKLAGNAELWNDGNLEQNSEFGTSGFTALPSGYRSNGSGGYGDIGDRGYFWSSSEYDSNNAWSRSLKYDYASVYRFYHGTKRRGFSVRCVRD